MILKIKDADGNVQEILLIKGEKGNDYVLTSSDKSEIATIVYSMMVEASETKNETEGNQ